MEIIKPTCALNTESPPVYFKGCTKRRIFFFRNICKLGRRFNLEFHSKVDFGPTKN